MLKLFVMCEEENKRGLLTERHRTSPNVTERHRASPNVTERHQTSLNVTVRHRTSQNVVTERRRASPDVGESVGKSVGECVGARGLPDRARKRRHRDDARDQPGPLRSWGAAVVSTTTTRSQRGVGGASIAVNIAGPGRLQ